jgi:hypothetical protein
MIVNVITGTDGIVVLPGVVDSNSFIKLSFPFCGSDILHTYVYVYIQNAPEAPEHNTPLYTTTQTAAV